MRKICLFLLLALAFYAPLQAQISKEELKACLGKDDVEDFKKLVTKSKQNLSEFSIEDALGEGAFKVASYIYQNMAEKDPNNLLDGSGILHSVPCYFHDKKEAFEFLAILLIDAKGLDKDPELYRSVICRFDMGEIGYENCKPAILALKKIGVDINGEILENTYDEENTAKLTFLIDVCRVSNEDMGDDRIDKFALWLIEQGADPHKKVDGKSAYSVASAKLKTAIDKQAADKKAAPSPAVEDKKIKGKKAKKAKKTGK